MRQYPFVANQKVEDLDWELYLKETANQIVQEQSPRKLLEVKKIKSLHQFRDQNLVYYLCPQVRNRLYAVSYTHLTLPTKA